MLHSLVKPIEALPSLTSELTIAFNHKKNKHMKKVLIICGLLFSVIAFANAQDAPEKKQGGRGGMGTPEERAQRTTDQLTKQLNLNEDQKAKVKTIYLEQAASMTKVREESKGDREAMMAKMKTANEETDKKVEALLNDDQKKTYATWKEERMKRRGPGGQGAGKPAGQ
jgi:protein CpxP